LILMPWFLGLFAALDSLDRISVVTGTVSGAANLFHHVLFRFALAVFVTLLPLVVRSIVLDCYQDSR
jgi:hypothetical protein